MQIANCILLSLVNKSYKGRLFVDPAFSRQYYESARDGHWWFNGRAALVSRLLSDRGIFGGIVGDLGAGSTSLFPSEFRIVGIDIVIPSPPPPTFVQADVCKLPIRDQKLDGVGIFDVLEHVEDRSTALAEARRIVRPGGFAVITVPAHQWLWSRHDEVVGHVRRYEVADLVEELRRSGWKTGWCSEFFGFLLPGAVLRKHLPWTPAFGYPRARINALMTRAAVRSARGAASGRVRLGLSIGAIAFRA